MKPNLQTIVEEHVENFKFAIMPNKTSRHILNSIKPLSSDTQVMLSLAQFFLRAVESSKSANYHMSQGDMDQIESCLLNVSSLQISRHLLNVLNSQPMSLTARAAHNAWQSLEQSGRTWIQSEIINYITEAHYKDIPEEEMAEFVARFAEMICGNVEEREYDIVLTTSWILNGQDLDVDI